LAAFTFTAGYYVELGETVYGYISKALANEPTPIGSVNPNPAIVGTLTLVALLTSTDSSGSKEVLIVFAGNTLGTAWCLSFADNNAVRTTYTDANAYASTYDSTDNVTVYTYFPSAVPVLTSGTTYPVTDCSVVIVTPTGNGDFPSPFTWQDANGNLPPVGFANDTDGTNF
jgi:hypothetical protein